LGFDHKEIVMTTRIKAGKDNDKKDTSDKKGTWKVKVVKEATSQTGAIWRAQLSTAPDGTRFVGVRKFAVKKDGTEVLTRDGLSFHLGSTTVHDLELIVSLLNHLKMGTSKLQDSTPDSPTPEAESVVKYVLWSPTLGGILVKVRNGKGVADSQVKGVHKTFPTPGAAKAFREKHLGEDDTRWLAVSLPKARQKLGK